MIEHCALCGEVHRWPWLTCVVRGTWWLAVVAGAALILLLSLGRWTW